MNVRHRVSHHFFRWTNWRKEREQSNEKEDTMPSAANGNASLFDVWTRVQTRSGWEVQAHNNVPTPPNPTLFNRLLTRRITGPFFLKQIASACHAPVVPQLTISVDPGASPARSVCDRLEIQIQTMVDGTAGGEMDGEGRRGTRGWLLSSLIPEKTGLIRLSGCPASGADRCPAHADFIRPPQTAALSNCPTRIPDQLFPPYAPLRRDRSSGKSGRTYPDCGLGIISRACLMSGRRLTYSKGTREPPYQTSNVNPLLVNAGPASQTVFQHWSINGQRLLLIDVLTVLAEVLLTVHQV